ncbi:MAG: hypothetical protein PHQ86_08125, partial [Dehalococcoidales bacterium]|nr:hypothetical protein [Dehalococcoidales bacterium]
AGEWIELPCVVDTVNKTMTATVNHFTAFAIITLPPAEEEEVVTPPVEEVEEEEEEAVTPPVEEVEEEEEEAVTPPVEEVEEEEEEAVTPPVEEVGLSVWAWVLIGIGSVVVIGIILIYFMWYRPRKLAGYKRTD